MKRPWHIWIAFVACLSVVLAAMGWISATAIQSDRAERRMRAAAALEEDVRLALWRMDSHLWTLVSQETARPYFTYSAIYAADRSFAWTFNPSEQKMEPAAGQMLIPSPLLTQTPPHCRLYFQIQVPGNSNGAPAQPALGNGDANGDGPPAVDTPGMPESRPVVTCPQLPGRWKSQLDPALLNESLIRQSELRLAEFVRRVDAQALVDSIPAAPLWPVDRSGGGAALFADDAPPPLDGPFNSPALGPGVSQPSGDFNVQHAMQQASNQPAAPMQQAQAPAANPSANPSQLGQVAPNDPPAQQLKQADVAKGREARYLPPQQQQFSNWEYATRRQGYQQMALQNSLRNNSFLPTAEDVKIGLMSPVWVDGELLLARWVEVGSNRLLQGVWLDWPSLENELLSTVGDLFPQASLAPIVQPNQQQAERLLSVVPARFVPGAEPQLANGEWSPVTASLLVAWGCVLLAAVAVGTLLAGVVRLSERRASFVSAVTHELRTPLTTFRMYSDMLAEGMVPDEQRQQQYLGTLRTEADRLGHLVENVLAYARLERGRQRRRPQELAVAELMQQVQPRLADRAARDELQLESAISPLVAERRVCTDVSALEQILFNLVDNACKYAQGSRPLIQLEAAAAGPATLRITVRDYGPGIGQQERRRLFRPFHKSAKDAAHSAPGVGLGLALSRRLARDLGGKLSIDPAVSDGAAFVLTLPLVPS